MIYDKCRKSRYFIKYGKAHVLLNLYIIFFIEIELKLDMGGILGGNGAP